MSYPFCLVTAVLVGHIGCTGQAAERQLPCTYLAHHDPERKTCYIYYYNILSLSLLFWLSFFYYFCYHHYIQLNYGLKQIQTLIQL